MQSRRVAARISSHARRYASKSYEKATSLGHAQPRLEEGSARRQRLEARIKRWRLWSLGLFAFPIAFGGLYLAQLVIALNRPPDQQQPGPKTQDELRQVYDRTAKSFDADVHFTERLAGITKLRKRLAGQCRGHVLEVSCGTARNLGYYPFRAKDGIKSLTLADISWQMVEQGRVKWYALRGAGQLGGDVKNVPVRFWHGDVKGEMPPPPADADGGGVQLGYDTIIQSMGLCSTDEPVELLRNLAEHLNPTNDEARILLLEHGRSYVPWWNKILDSGAAHHASRYGCWWNRDIGEIVEQSGLEIVKERRNNFGTTWIYELRPAKHETQTVTESSAQLKSSEAVEEDQGGWEAWIPRWMYERICKR